MKRVLLLIALAALLALPVRAQSVAEQEAKILGADTLYDGLDSDARALLGDAPPTAADFGKSLWRVITQTLSELPLREALRTGGMLLAVLVLCALCADLDASLSARAVSLAGALGLTAICAGSLRSMIGLATETLDRVGSFTTLLLPVLSAALTASGGVTSGAALYVGSMMFFDALVRLVRGLLIPLTYAYVAVAAAECAAGEGRLLRLCELIDWSIRSLLKGVLYLFTAYLAITGIVTGSSDEAAVKAASSALGAAVPVVGSILSDAAGSVLAGARLVKNSAGVFGVLALLSIGLAPFLRIGLHYLVLKGATAIGGTLDAGANAKLLEKLTSAMGYMLAMTGSCILMSLLSCCCFMKAVGI